MSLEGYSSTTTNQESGIQGVVGELRTLELVLIFDSDFSIFNYFKPFFSLILRNFTFVPNLNKLVFSISEFWAQFCRKSLAFWK